MKIVTATEMAKLDRRAIDEKGIPGIELMDRAGRGVFKYIKDFIDRKNISPSVALFAGKGNNGGDVFVAARYLEDSGIKNSTYVLCDPAELKGDARDAFLKLKGVGARIVQIETSRQLEEHQSEIEQSEILIDGILGTGIKGEVKGFFAEVIKLINSIGKPVIAIDIPSGVSGDTGIEEGLCVHAAATVTMALPKQGFFLGKSLNHLGDLKIVDIGIPESVVQEAESKAELLTHEEMASLIPRRERISHKGTYGRLLVLAGSRGYTGAAALVCQGALRAGAGLVYLGVPRSLNPIFETKLTETITIPLDETPAATLAASNLQRIKNLIKDIDAVVIGPGISTAADTATLVKKLLDVIEIPIILDADGLNCLKGETESLRFCKSPLIVTPHPGEMARLIGGTVGKIMVNPWETASEFARKNGVITVLKGAPTTIAEPGGGLFVNIKGNSGMASAGTGDVLAGMLGGFIVQGIEALDAAKLSVFMHGFAGDIAVEKYGPHSLIATDLIAAIPHVFKRLSGK